MSVAPTTAVVAQAGTSAAMRHAAAAAAAWNKGKLSGNNISIVGGTSEGMVWSSGDSAGKTRPSTAIEVRIYVYIYESLVLL
jgi:hypothetical protein